jgi:hypothetical protein
LWTGRTAGIIFHRNPFGCNAKVLFPAIDETSQIPNDTFNNLIGYALHELGHAWFTDNKPWDDARNRHGHFVSNLINGLEDPRIERKVIESGRAPNSRALFENLLNSVLKRDGYVEADDKKNIPFLLAVEGRRLNGYQVNVPNIINDSPWAKHLHWALKRASQAKDTATIVKIAIELFKRIKEQEQEEKQKEKEKGQGQPDKPQGGDGEQSDMPPYPLISTDILMPKLTDKEVAAGKPLRVAARNKVVNEFNKMILEQKAVKKVVKTDWNKLDDSARSKLQDMLDRYKSLAYLNLFNYIKTELVWWNNNIELSPRQVNTRDMKYDEILSSKQAEYDNFVQSNISENQSRENRANKEKEEASVALRNRTSYDDVSDTFSSLVTIILRILYILVALRCASFAANEYLYKPIPYRILIFIYTFIFAPIAAPYYLWKGIEHYIWDTPLPPYEGFFPLFPYDKSEPLDFNRRLVGYNNTIELKEWITKKQEAERAARDAAVLVKGLKAKIIEEHSG